MLDNSCILRSSYDQINDILYLRFSNKFPNECYGDDDIYENIILQRLIKNDEIQGVTILYANAEKMQREQELYNLGFSFDLAKLL